MDSSKSTGLTQREIQLLKISNKELCKTPDAMQNIFLEYFRQYPQHQEFFSFRDVPFDELTEDKRFNRQCNLVNSCMTSCIENIDDYDVVESILLTLGKSHKRFNIPPEAFWESRDVIVDGISKVVDMETHSAYSKYWDLVVNITLRGFMK